VGVAQSQIASCPASDARRVPRRRSALPCRYAIRSANMRLKEGGGRGERLQGTQRFVARRAHASAKRRGREGKHARGACAAVGPDDRDAPVRQRQIGEYPSAAKPLIPILRLCRRRQVATTPSCAYAPLRTSMPAARRTPDSAPSAPTASFAVTTLRPRDGFRRDPPRHSSEGTADTATERFRWRSRPCHRGMVKRRIRLSPRVAAPPTRYAGEIEPRAPLIAEHPHVVNRRDAPVRSPATRPMRSRTPCSRSQRVDARVPLGLAKTRLALDERKP